MHKSEALGECLMKLSMTAAVHKSGRPRGPQELIHTFFMVLNSPQNTEACINANEGHGWRRRMRSIMKDQKSTQALSSSNV